MKRFLTLVRNIAILVVLLLLAGGGTWWWFFGRGSQAQMFVAAPCPPADEPDALAGIEGWAPGASNANKMGGQAAGNLGGMGGGLAGGDSSTPTPSPAPAGGNCRAFSPAMNEHFAKLAALRKRLPTIGSDVAALGATLKTADDAYAFVRDNIHTSAYAGVMRGSRGTLMAASGSSADKALLLHDLLTAINVPSQFVHATLSDAETTQVVTAATAPVAIDEKAVVAGPNAQASLDEGIAVAQSSLATMRKVLKTKGLAPSTDASTELAAMRAAVGDHWWVRAQIDGATVDLDPTIAGASRGTHLGAQPSDAPADAIPDALHHTLTIRLLADTGSGPQPVAQVVSSSVAALEKTITVSMTGTATPDVATTASTYTPNIAIGDNANAGSPLAPDGPTPLRALYLEVQTLTPGGTPLTHRQVVLDRRGASGTVDPSWTPVRTAYALEFAYRGMEAVGDSDAVYDMGVNIDAMLQGALVADYGLQHPGAPAVSDQPLSDYAYEAHRYFEDDQSIRLALREHDPTLTFAFDHPLVALYRQAFDDRASGLNFVQSFDIVDDSLVALSNGAVANDANAERGLMDTAIERALITGPGTRLDTSAVMAAAKNAGVSLVALGPSDVASAPANAKDALGASVTATTVAIAPSSSVTLGGIPSYGWVETDLATGNTVGRMASGAGQAAAEEGVLHKFIGNYTYIKGFARCLNCFFSWATQSVTSQADITKQDGDEATCLGNAICQFAVDFATDFFLAHGFEAEGSFYGTIMGPYIDLAGELLHGGPTGAVCSGIGHGDNPYSQPIIG